VWVGGDDEEERNYIPFRKGFAAAMDVGLA
jgi:hypothetical protein